MLMGARTLEGYALHARDGVIGEVQDVYFDDHEWTVRYFVVSTGTWLKGRQVLIGAEAVAAPETTLRTLPVDLTTEQVRRSPDTDSAPPVSRQKEAELRKYYGWPPYWGPIFADGGLAGPLMQAVPPPEAAREMTDRPLRRKKDPHLRSTNDTVGYHIEATDGGIGHLEDLLVDRHGWRIRYLVIDTRNWWPGRKVIISPEWIREVSWENSRVVVDHAKDAIKASPPYDPSAPFDPEYAVRLHKHYDRPPPPPASAPLVRDDNPNRP